MSDTTKHILFVAGLVVVLAFIVVPVLRVKFLAMKAKAQAEAQKIGQAVKKDLRD